MKKFVSTMRKGFHITFENGLEASVQWGAGNYCDNHFPEDMDFTFSKDAESNTAEVAVVRGSKFVDISAFLPDDIYHDTMVAGYLTPDQVVDFLAAVKNYKGEVHYV
jgi:hypothetical protein